MSKQTPVPLEFEGERFTPEYAAITRSHELIPEERSLRDTYTTEIRIIRHGITQGYSTDAGLTPMGGWQAHRRGHELARRWDSGDKVRLVCALSLLLRLAGPPCPPGATPWRARLRPV